MAVLEDDEFRRNDSVLLAAALLMAILFAWTTTADPRALVHLKTGQYLAENGFLPPAGDVFSATVEGTPWLNLAWLGDLFLAGVHAVGGMVALTIWQVIGALLTFGLVFACHRKGVSTWWASLVVVLAGIAAMPNLQAQPALFTLIGLAAMQWIVVRYRRDLVDSAIWWLIPLFVVWANVDSRMFLGLALLLLYGAGELLGVMLGRPGFEDNPRRARYWAVVGGCLLVSLVNPNTWRAPLGGWHLYGSVDPAFREHFSGVPSWRSLCHMRIFDPPMETWLDTALLAGALMGVVALVTMVLNRRKLDLGHVFVWLGFTAFGVLAGREWPAAAVVYAVLAIRNAEDWYHQMFRSTGRLERGELLFSRWGRALTVLAFFVLAALWVTGRIIPDDGRRPGYGLDPALANQLESLRTLMKDAHERKVFNFHLGQGDQLIWLGYQPFIDHRLELYDRPDGVSERSLIATHRRVREALRQNQPGQPDWSQVSIWRPVFQKHGIHQAVPRLTYPQPNYDVYFDLIGQPDWQLARLEAAGALFYYVEPENAELAETLRATRMDLSREAFRDVEPLPEIAPMWAEPAGWSSQWMRREPMPNRMMRAQHCAQHFERAKAGRLNLAPPVAIALSQLGIHDCYSVIAEDPQNAHAYRCLGQLFEMLFANERQLMSVPPNRRMFQALGAYGQALLIEPNNPATQEHLVSLYLWFGKYDLARQAAKRYEELMGVPFPEPKEENIAQSVAEMWKVADEAIAEVTKRAELALDEKQPRLEVAAFAWQNGCSLLAMKILTDEKQLVETDPTAAMLKAHLHLELAQPKEAHEILTMLEQAAPQTGMTGWQEPLALASLALPDFDRAEELYKGLAENAVESQMAGVMQTLPLVGQVRGFPVMQTLQVSQALEAASGAIAQHRFNLALCALDRSDMKQAEKELDQLLTDYPLTMFTSVAGFYLGQIRNEPTQVELAEALPPDRFSGYESTLNRELITEQLRASGPREARRPGR